MKESKKDISVYLLLFKELWLPLFETGNCPYDSPTLCFSQTLLIYSVWNSLWMAQKSKILIIGGSGSTGKYIVEESAKAGHPTFALVRENTALILKSLNLLRASRALDWHFSMYVQTLVLHIVGVFLILWISILILKVMWLFHRETYIIMKAWWRQSSKLM